MIFSTFLSFFSHFLSPSCILDSWAPFSPTPPTAHALTALAGTPPPKNTLLVIHLLHEQRRHPLYYMSELFMLCSTACEAQHERVFSFNFFTLNSYSFYSHNISFVVCRTTALNWETYLNKARLTLERLNLQSYWGIFWVKRSKAQFNYPWPYTSLIIYYA